MADVFLDENDAHRRERVAVPRLPVTATYSVTLDGRFDAWNPAFERATGYSYEELKRAPVRALLRPDGIDQEPFELFYRLKREDGGSATFTSWLKTKNGQRVDIHGVVTWVEHLQRWDVVIEVDPAQMPVTPQFMSPWDQLPIMQWHQAEDQKQIQQLALKVEDLSGQIRDLAGGTTSNQRHPRRGHHDDKPQFVAQVLQILGDIDPWDYKIREVRERLDPPVKSDNTFKFLLDFHQMLIGGSIKLTLDKMIAALPNEDRLLFPVIPLLLLLYMMFDVWSDGRLDGIIHWCSIVHLH